MLFIPKRDKDIFKAYPELLAIPEFYELNERQMTALIWFADYRSPFRQKPKEERMRLACLEAGYKVMEDKNTTMEFRAREMMAGKVDKWNTALKKYMDMQHDEAREQIDMVDAQVDNIRKIISTPTDDEAILEKRNKLINSLPDLNETKRKLAKQANMEELVMGVEESVAGEGNKRTLSLLDEEVEKSRVR